MNWLGILILIGLYPVYRGIRDAANHHHEQLAFDVLYRVGRWFVVVSVTWVVVAIAMRGLHLLDVSSQFSTTHHASTFEQ